MTEVEDELIQLAAECETDPLRWVRLAYDWGVGELSAAPGPREWQTEMLTQIRDHLSNPETRYQPLMLARASGHGIGKSAGIGMIINWALSTCDDCKVVVTANTDTQLRTKTSPEVGKWQRMSLTAPWFDVHATSIAVKDPQHAKTWRADFVPWSETNTEAFAGLHNKGKRIVLVFDEASAIADKVWEVAEGALTDENTEIIWIAFGNPTRNIGRFRECFGRLRHRWKTRQIDSRKVEGTNKDQIAKWVEDYGEDSDFVRVRVRGVFPRAGTMQFIPSDAIELAATREDVEVQVFDPLVFGVDPARFGDDQSVIYMRKGRDGRTMPPLRFRGIDTMTLAAKVAELYQQMRPDAVFVDGGGVGGGVVDRLRQLRIPVIEVQFGAAADRSLPGQDGVVYANKATEMWANMREWLKGGAIPDDPELRAELEGREYGYAMIKGRDCQVLEKKSDMKKRGLSSPDTADALALTFAYPVERNRGAGGFPGDRRHNSNVQVDYDPFNG